MYTHQEEDEKKKRKKKTFMGKRNTIQVQEVYDDKTTHLMVALGNINE